MAIGAGRADVLRMILGQGMTLAIAGLAVGLLASLGARRLLIAAFGNTRPAALDFIPFLLVTSSVLAVTLAGCVPARPPRVARRSRRGVALRVSASLAKRVDAAVNPADDDQSIGQRG